MRITVADLIVLWSLFRWYLPVDGAVKDHVSVSESVLKIGLLAPAPKATYRELMLSWIGLSWIGVKHLAVKIVSPASSFGIADAELALIEYANVDVP